MMPEVVNVFVYARQCYVFVYRAFISHRMPHFKNRREGSGLMREPFLRHVP